MRGLWLLAVVLISGCTSLTTLYFFPQSMWVATPAESGLDYQDLYLRAADHAELHAWWIPAQGEAPASDTVVLYLHGNAENISSHARTVYWLAHKGVGVLALDYRGFGASTGQALFPDVLQDVDAALRWLRTWQADKKIVILAQSIGTAVAVDYLAKAGGGQGIKALVLDAPIARFGSVARHAFSQSVVGWVLWPFTVLLPSRDDPIEHIDMLHLPVLILHSQSDKVVPYEQGQRLYQKWRQLHSEQTLCWQEAKGGHVMSFAFPELRQTTLAFILNAKC